jgi:pimeloyl-ACP methyl ester carboxylesterase
MGTATPTGPAGRGRLRYATEPLRSLVEGGALAASLPLLRLAPRGEPHPVLVLPGLLASDRSTAPLRGWLRRLGYPVVGWDLGRNRGPTRAVVDGLPRLVDRLATEHGGPVSLVGWSLGGIFARKLAVRAPGQVRQVVTLGSPFAVPEGSDDRSVGTQVYRRYARLHAAERVQPDADAARRPLPVPSTSVYSREDGIVDWRACLQQAGPTSENVAVRGSHLGLGHNPAALWVVADRLAQPVGRWRPFRPPNRLGIGALFPTPDEPGRPG